MAGKQETITRAEFVAALSKRVGLRPYTTDRIMKEVLRLFIDTWCEGRSICFVGFGTFKLRATPEKMARNPKTMEACKVPAGYKPSLRVRQELRKYINEQIQNSRVG